MKLMRYNANNGNLSSLILFDNNHFQGIKFKHSSYNPVDIPFLMKCNANKSNLSGNF